MENWKLSQEEQNSSAFAKMMETRFPDADYTSDPDRYYDRVCVECNYLNAIRSLDWNSLLPENARILDLAGGTGWMSAFLSTFSKVKSITIVDQSRQYLEVNLPVAIRRLNGDSEKIVPVEGVFSPLILPDASIDVLAVSSSLHHANVLEDVLREIHRVLVPGGKCLILNEVPIPYIS